MTLSIKTFSASSLAIAIAVISQTSHADKLEEVIVTGELRDSNVLTLANSVSVIGADVLAARDAQHLEDVLNLAPNVNYSTGASRGRFLQIRGIGERSQFVDPVSPSVGVMVDGIDFSGISLGVTTLDTKQVEVFRGPQGTLYGANALAGMINVVGNDVSEEFSGQLNLDASSYSTFAGDLALSKQFSDIVGWRGAVKQTSSDGYIKNATIGTNDTNNIDEFSLKNLFTFKLTKDLNASLTSYLIDVANGYDAFSLDNNRTTYSEQPGRDTQETSAHALNIEYSGLKLANLNVVASQADSDMLYSYDEDWASAEICDGLTDCWPYSSFDSYSRHNANQSFDARLISKNTEGFTWVAGAYHRTQKVELDRIYTNNDDETRSYYSSRFKTDHTAIYGEGRLPISQSLTLVSGLRLEDFSGDFWDNSDTTFNPSEVIWGGKLALELQLSDKEMVYALVSRGYKVNGFNTDPDLEESEKTYDTETMINLEVGTKGRWLNDTLTGQVAYFYQFRNDVQVKQSRAYIDSDDRIQFIDFRANAAEGVNYGLEAELNWQPTSGLTLFSSLGLLQTEYRDFVNLSHVDRDGENGYNMNGRAQPHAPSYQYTAGALFQFSDKLNAKLEWEGKDGFYFSANHEEQAEAYTLINARIAYQLNDVELALWAKNLTDATVESRGFYFSHDFGNDPRKGYAPEPYTQKGAPRTLGVSASYSF